MELKPHESNTVCLITQPLIVPYGIETPERVEEPALAMMPLIVPYGIETS